MSLAPLPFATQSYKHDALAISAQRCVNLYAEAQPRSAKTQVALLGTPGVTSFATCGTGPVRGIHVLADTLYVVSGAFLYSVSSTGGVSQLGGQISGTDVVSMDDNGSEIAIVNGTNGYLYSTASGFRLITDSDFLAANTVTHLDGYFLFEEAGDNKVFRSASLDGTDYDSTAFARKESKSDNVLAVKGYDQVLYVLGEKTIELWADTGAANFPFERIPGVLINRGIAGPHAVTDADEALFVLGDDKVAYRLDGKALKRISTHAIEHHWQSLGDVSDVIAYSHSWGGHKFVYFTFPTTSETWVYDIATKLWHERVSWDRTGNDLGRWRINAVTEHYDKVLVGDCFTGEIGYLSDTTYDEYGSTIQALAVSPPISANENPVFLDEFQLLMEAGTGQGSDPQVMMDISRDGGHTWGTLQKWQSLGDMGDYRQRLRWPRLGTFYTGHIRITISDPVKRRIVGAYIQAESGA